MPGLTGRWHREMAGAPGSPVRLAPLAAPADWTRLAGSGSALDWVVLYAPGGGRPDPRYARAAACLRASGVRVLGRLDAAFGARTTAEVAGDARRYIDGYGVGGFYLDRAPADRAGLAGCRRTTAELAAMLAGAGCHGGHVVLGHGTHPDPGYAEAADQLVTFNGPWRDYRWSEAPEWTAAHPPERFCHLVRGVPRPHLETALRIARWQGAGSVFLTDRDGPDDSGLFEGLPTYLDSMAGMLRDRPRTG